MTFSHSTGGKLPGYDVVMLVYLVTGALLLPMLVGETLTESGLIAPFPEPRMDGKLIPQLVYAYGIFVTFAGAFALFVAWIPAIIVCLKYRKHWRAVVPAVAILVCTAALFFMGSSKTMEYVGALAAAIYVLSAFSVGLEWLIKQMR